MIPTFDLAAVPIEHRRAALGEAITHGPIPYTLDLTRITHLRASNRRHLLGPVRASDTTLAGADGRLRRRGSSSSEEGALIAQVVVEGELGFEQAGRRAVPSRGEVVLTTTTLPIVVTQRSMSRKLAVVVPFDELRVPFSAIEPLIAVALGSREPLGSVVASYLKRAVITPPEHVPPELMGRSVVEMLRALIAASVGDRSSAVHALGTTLGDRIMEYCRVHLDDPDLSAARIAHAHGISVRYLYLTLSRAGISLGDWIRERRVDMAARMLTEPEYAHLTVGDIARRVGFAEQAHFSRVFRRFKEMTPREWRRSAAERMGA